MSIFEFIITDSQQMVDLSEYLNYLILERTSEWERKVLGRDQDTYQALIENLKIANWQILRIKPL